MIISRQFVSRWAASRRIATKLTIVLLFGVALVGKTSPSGAAPADEDLVKKGEYLARIGDCTACHTLAGGKPFAGGLVLGTPFGGIPVPNITPDKATGIGDWSDDDFYRAMHEGIARDGSYLYPAFPFPWYTKVTRQDALAIKAYLFSLPPENAPKKPLDLAFPFNVREGLLAWRTAFFSAGEFKPDPSKSAEINRGAYLVEGLGHCGECHNHNALLGASNWSGMLQGGQVGGWYAPNLTSDGREGIGKWSAEQIVTFLKTGASPGNGVVLGPMKDTIAHSLSHLSDSDLRAIAAYLKSVPSDETYKPVVYSGFKGPHAFGESTYFNHCAACHRADGKGVAGIFPALAGNGAVKAGGPENVIRVVLGGLSAKDGLAPMPAVGAGMTDAEISAVVDYVRQAWGNDAPTSEGSGTVGDLRAKTQTLLAANLPHGCPAIEDQNLAKAIDESNAAGQLKAMKTAVNLDDVDAMLKNLLPKAKQLAPKATDDDIVNALTIAYCPIATSGNASQADAAARLGDFSTLVYGQIKHGGAQN